MFPFWKQLDKGGRTMSEAHYQATDTQVTVHFYEHNAVRHMTVEWRPGNTPTQVFPRVTVSEASFGLFSTQAWLFQAIALWDVPNRGWSARPMMPQDFIRLLEERGVGLAKGNILPNTMIKQETGQ